jgi:hypothetical protein
LAIAVPSRSAGRSTPRAGGVPQSRDFHVRHTMRPIRPEPSEHPKIKRAYRAAKFMKWWSNMLMGLTAILSIVVGHYTVWYLGLVLVLILWGVLLVGGYSHARCPHCGQVWWSSRMALMFVLPLWLLFLGEDNDETESFVCRRCRLDIGYGLK